MSKTFLEVNVGDTVFCYDEYTHDFIEHEIKVESIEEDEEYATDTNPKGRVLYGEDLTYGDNDDLMLCTVFESNFLSA